MAFITCQNSLSVSFENCLFRGNEYQIFNYTQGQPHRVAVSENAYSKSQIIVAQLWFRLLNKINIIHNMTGNRRHAHMNTASKYVCNLSYNGRTYASAKITCHC